MIEPYFEIDYPRIGLDKSLARRRYGRVNAFVKDAPRGIKCVLISVSGVNYSV